VIIASPFCIYFLVVTIVRNILDLCIVGH